MAKFRYDRSSKWLIEHHGDQILRLGGVRDVVSWRSVQAEVVQPRQIPDGLLEVQRAGQPQPDLFLVEIATYPDRRVAEQVMDDVTLVLQDRRVLPDVLVLVLHPKGNVEVAAETALPSRGGWTHLRLSWRVVALWTLPAEDLLRTEEPGLMPWVLLTSFAGPPEPVFRRCREVIDERARPEEHDNLLAVTQVLAGLRYNDARLLALLGGKEAMIESPVLQELLAERMHQVLLRILEVRFGLVPPDVEAALRAVMDDDRLQELVAVAASCPDLETFRQQLAP